ncbi:hypothetical protein GCM10027612_67020 [Microbispora bryophytorum subsp. camponoti]
MAALIPLRRRPDGAMPGERHSASPDDAADTAEDGVPDVRRASWVLPTAPSSTSRARRLVRATLRDWAGSVDGETPEVAELLVSELIANVLRHGRGNRSSRSCCRTVSCGARSRTRPAFRYGSATRHRTRRRAAGGC